MTDLCQFLSFDSSPCCNAAKGKRDGVPSCRMHSLTLRHVVAEPFKYKTFDEVPIGTWLIYNLEARQQEMKTKWLGIQAKEMARAAAA